MRRQRHGLLGVELEEHEIRVVETRTTGGKTVVTAAGSVAMPYGGMHDGALLRIDTVAAALRRLIESIGATTKDAVLGVSSGGSIVRSLTVPPAPDDELAVMVEGEVRHYQIVESQTSAYDFFKLQGTSRETAQGILLMAAEDTVTGSLRELGHKVGLNVAALEPVTVAMYRTAFPRLAQLDSALFVAMTDSAVELALACKGVICVYRRLDFGANSLFGIVSGAAPPIGMAPQFDAPPETTAAPSSPTLQEGPLGTLSIELRRSVEFFSREYADAPPVEHLLLAGGQARTVDLVAPLASATDLQIELVKPPPDAGDPKTELELAGDQACRYAGAYGLSRNIPDAYPREVPMMDLFVHERRSAEVEIKRRGFAGALSVSILAVVAGIIGAYIYGMRANGVEHELSHLEADLNGLESRKKLNAEEETARQQQVAKFSQDNAPIRDVIDTVSACLDPGTGLQEITVASGGAVTFSGEATDMGSLIRTTQNLQGAPSIVSAAIVSFEKIDAKGASPGVKFQVRAQQVAVTAPPPPAAPTPREGGAK